jgi:hypothetical protein
VGDVCVTSPGRFGVCGDVSVFLEKKEVSRMNEQKGLLLEIAEAIVGDCGNIHRAMRGHHLRHAIHAGCVGWDGSWCRTLARC